MKLKHFFKHLFSGITVAIQSGPLKGKKWIATSGSKFVKGKFETYKSNVFLKEFNDGNVFFDIGAHFGYFSLMADGLGGKVFAFEPRPGNRSFFERHMRINTAKNVTLYPYAIGDKEGTVHFNTNTGSATGHVSETGDLTVEMISMDQWVSDGKLPKPDFIKIDVEGGELEVLKGCYKTISTYKPKLLVATHSEILHKNVLSVLDQHGYSYEVLEPESSTGDTEIMAVPL